MSSEPREIICNEDTFKIPPYSYDTLKVYTTCPESGRTSCSSMLAADNMSIDVPESGCKVEFLKADGKEAQQAIMLVREDAERLEQKRRANREAQALKDAEEGMKPLEGMVEQYMSDAPESVIATETQDGEETETEPQPEATEVTAPDCVIDDDDIMAGEDMMEIGCEDTEEDCAEQPCDEGDEDFDESGDYTYPSED